MNELQTAVYFSTYIYLTFKIVSKYQSSGILSVPNPFEVWIIEHFSDYR